MNGETCVFSASTIHLRYESQQQLNGKICREYISVTADSSLLSPTGGVNTIPPDTEIHEQMTMTNGYEKVCTTTSTLPTSVRPLWTVDNYVNDATHVDSSQNADLSTPACGL